MNKHKYLKNSIYTDIRPSMDKMLDKQYDIRLRLISLDEHINLPIEYVFLLLDFMTLGDEIEVME